MNVARTEDETTLTSRRQKPTATDSRYIRWLEDLNQNSVPEAGGKAANLGEMIHAGLPVPPGLVVTADAYRVHLDAGHLPDRIAARLQNLLAEDLTAVTAASDDIMGWIGTAPMPDAIRAAVASSYDGLSRRLIVSENGAEALRVAVRSSATAEDLPSASFAGQQETYLNIGEAEAVIDAVRKCWASLWTPQAISYRASMNFDHLGVALAVVVQALVAADTAGVMFTANPVSGARDEILISGSYGLGEAVVSGVVTPDTYILSQDGNVKQRTLGTKEIRVVADASGTHTEAVPQADQRRYCLSDYDLAALADVGRRVQAHYGSPMDIEWVLSNGELYVVQARPITTLNRMPAHPLAPADEAPINTKIAGDWEAFEYWPEPTTPLDISFYIKCRDGAATVYKFFGMRPPTKQNEAVERPDGRIAVRIYNPRRSPAMLWAIPGRLLFQRGDPLKKWQAVVGEYNAMLKQWRLAESAGIEAQDAAALARLVVQEMSDFPYLMAARGRAMLFPFRHYVIWIYLWAWFSNGLKGANALRDRLLRAVPFLTSLQNQAVDRLVKIAKTQGKNSPEYKSALADFMAEWGSRPARGITMMPSIPSWREAPDVVNGLVDALLSDSTAAPEEALRRDEADFRMARAEVESRLWSPLRRLFHRHLEFARNGLIGREDGRYRMEIMTTQIRHTALLLGDMLVTAGILSSRDDVLFLLSNELEPVAQGKLDPTERIARRKQGFARLVAANECVQHWLVASGSIAAPKPKNAKNSAVSADGHSLSGQAAAGGVATGPVCVVHGPHEFSKLRKGDVLVAPFTAPVWTPLFRLASAVVTEIGGAGGHAAIVAREYGIPALVAVPRATTLLCDGQRVRVDADRETVSIVGAAQK